MVQRKQIAKVIVEERRAANLSQEQVAKKVRRRQEWVSKLESGQRRIDCCDFFRLAGAIGFDPIAALTRLHS